MNELPLFNPAAVTERKPTLRQRLEQHPWWFVALILIAVWAMVSIITTESYREAFLFVLDGIGITISTSLWAYAFALVIGLVAGLGRLSGNVFIKNIATLYVELVRGIPMLVIIFYIALVGVPGIVGGLQGFGETLGSWGLEGPASVLAGMDNQNIPMNLRAIVALAITYGAFQAEIFRAGIQSIPRGQMEAARSLGMTYGQAMWYVVLPQAIRNVLPALGNDFIAMVKDSSLVSVLAVRDITQVARLYAGRSFRFNEAYTTLAVLYLAMTLTLSLLVKWLEKRLEHSR